MNKQNSRFTALLCFLMVKGVYLNLSDALTNGVNCQNNNSLVKSTHFDTIET
jgi:hypothetical protein